MTMNVTRLETVKGQGFRLRERVAAYCRVSTSDDAQLESLEAQKKHFTDLLESHPGWEYAGIYYDEGISGTGMEDRAGFNRLLKDGAMGKFDRVVVKSVSRFARNTIDSLSSVRKLIEAGIPVYFEKEGIDTGTMNNEFLLSIFSGFAEEEARSSSQNIHWAAVKRFQDGTYIQGMPPYGYRNLDGVMVPDEGEAPVAREVFTSFLAGTSPRKIARELNGRGLRTRLGRKWTEGTVIGMLKNERYKGAVLYQKRYTDDWFKHHRNKGQQPQYFIEDHHEGICTKEEFELVQKSIELRKQKCRIESGTSKYLIRYPTTGKVFCARCGKQMRHSKSNHSGGYKATFLCNTHIRDNADCSMKPVFAEELEFAFVDLMKKLEFSRSAVLAPYFTSLLKKSGGRSRNTPEEIKAQREKLSKLLERQYINATQYRLEMQKLDAEEKSLSLMVPESNGDELSETRALLAWFGTNNAPETFDGTLFTTFVDRVILSREEAVFHMKCGLDLREVF